MSDLGITFVPGQYVSQLLVADGTCFGAFAFDLATGERTAFLADAVVLATGGHTRIWRCSSFRRDENYGEGMTLGLQAGCRLSDMELVQFHRTGMVQPEDLAGTLVTEAVRGEGGRLFNALGERFMDRYDPERLELSTRDRVAFANYTEIAEGRGGPNGGVFLDVSHLDKSMILEKLPRMYRQFIEHQMLDISKHPMEVAPTAHYSMGGVVVDAETTATEVDGLFAAGEVTAGLHGANRLGGNSLAETLVFGKRAGEQAAARSAATDVMLRPRAVVGDAAGELDALVRPGAELARPLQRAVRDLMWETSGVVRDDVGRRRGLAGVHELANAATDVDVSPTEEGWGDLGNFLDLRSALTTAEATLLGALARTESRGAHNRSDRPALDEGQRVNHRVRRDAASGELSLTTDPVPPTSEQLRTWLTEPVVAVDGDRLLE